MLWEGVGDGVGPIMLWHEFGNLCLAFAFVGVAAVFGGEHNKVTDLIDILRCPVFISMIFLADFRSKEVVLCFVNIEIARCDDLMCGDLLSGCMFSKGDNWWNDAW